VAYPIGLQTDFDVAGRPRISNRIKAYLSLGCRVFLTSLSAPWGFGGLTKGDGIEGRCDFGKAPQAQCKNWRPFPIKSSYLPGDGCGRVISGRQRKVGEVWSKWLVVIKLRW